MYLDYYNLSEKPFQITSDSHFLWLGDKHKEALAAFKYGVIYDKSFLLLTGPVGTGKTTLTNALVGSLGPDVISAKIVDPHLDPLDFFKFVARAFKIDDEIQTKADFLSAFTDFLHQSQQAGKKVLLIIDEAQRMDEPLLEEIRLLSNIEKEELKLLTIFFVGHTEFMDKLSRNYAIQQRITVNYELATLSNRETDKYVTHRLAVAGREEPLFTTDATAKIYQYSDGTPRLINIICDHALLTGFLNKADTIDGAVIDKSVMNMRVPGHREIKMQAKQAQMPVIEDTPAPLFDSATLDNSSLQLEPDESNKTNIYVIFFSVLFVILAVSGFLLVKSLLGM